MLASITAGPDPGLRQHLALPLFQEYAEWMATKFLLLVEVPDTSRVRRVMKISYSQPLERVATARWHRWTSMAGWRPAQFHVDVQGVGEGQTYHCEFEGPQGLEVGRAELVLNPTHDGELQQRYAGEIVGRRAHIYAPDAPLGADGIASIWLLSPRSGLVRAALFTSAVIAAVFLFFFVDGRITETMHGRTLPLLLAAPGVVAGFVLRPGEHRIATDLLAGVRAAVAVSALSACVGALIIGADVAESTVAIAWKTLGIAAALCFTSLSVAYCFVSYRTGQEERVG
ncbi:MAG: hypothetical protein M3279_04205 [Actinomycetota bacterium]|nr:hypothetical protein [Actinomycetota bacterium]